MGFREVLRRVIEWSNRNPGENDNHGKKKIIIIRTSVKTWKNRHRLFARRSGWICSRTEVLITVARDRLFRERIIQIASPAIAFGSCSFPPLLHSRLLLGFQTYYELNLTLGISEVSVRFPQFKFHSLSFVYSLKWLRPSPHPPPPPHSFVRRVKLIRRVCSLHRDSVPLQLHKVTVLQRENAPSYTHRAFLPWN